MSEIFKFSIDLGLEIAVLANCWFAALHRSELLRLAVAARLAEVFVVVVVLGRFSVLVGGRRALHLLTLKQV